ncbi:hypothetical protein ACTXT7_015831 [Hymenolepis weldensis]
MEQLEQRKIMLHKQQEILLEQFTKQLNLNTGQLENPIPKLCLDNVVLQISEFPHDVEVEHTNNNRFDKCKDDFVKDLADIPKEKRVRLLLWRLGTTKHRKLKTISVQKNRMISSSREQYPSEFCKSVWPRDAAVYGLNLGISVVY